MTNGTRDNHSALLSPAASILDSCDFCEAQEDGGHYCLLHSCQLKNANLFTCPDFKRSYRKRKARDNQKGKAS